MSNDPLSFFLPKIQSISLIQMNPYAHIYIDMNVCKHKGKTGWDSRLLQLWFRVFYARQCL